MGLLLDEEIASVRERVDIADVVRDSVTLKSAGVGKWKGLCPFHSENSPSFVVNSDRGLWHCFGCGEGGDAIDYLRQLDGLSFVEAVEVLAERVNINLTQTEDDPDRVPTTPRRALVDVNVATQEYYTEQFNRLPDHHPAVAILLDRGFTREDCSRHLVGYAPKNNALISHLQKQGFTLAAMIEAGVAMESKSGAKDRFVDRTIWPITSPKGLAIGFGARQLPTTPTGPKYLNTGDTVLYKKSSVLYGLSDARKNFSKTHQVVITEGYTDVMALASAGVEGAVATCGTAFGIGHVDVLNRTTVGTVLNVVFMFDGDSAGRKAVLRAYELYENDPARVFVALTPHNLDPCDLRQKEGDEAVRSVVKNRIPIVEYILKTIVSEHDLKSPTGKAAAANACADVLKPITNVMLKVEYEKMVSEWLNIDSAHMVRASYNSGKSSERPSWRDSSVRRSENPNNSEDEVKLEFPESGNNVGDIENEAIKAVLQYPEIVRDWFMSLEKTAFGWSGTQAAYQHILDALSTGIIDSSNKMSSDWLHNLLNSAKPTELRSFLVKMSMDSLHCNASEVDLYVVDAISLLVDKDAARRINILNAILEDLDPDSKKYSEAFADLIALTSLRKTLPHNQRGFQKN